MLNYKDTNKLQEIFSKKLFLTIAFFVFCFVSQAVQAEEIEKDPLLEAQEISRIVATVNDDIITGKDFASRLNLALFSSGLPPKPDIIKNLSPQIMQSLIDERLKLQIAQENEIEISEDAIDDQVKILAERNNLSLEEFLDKLKQANVPLSTMKNQIRADSAWSQYVQSKLRRQIDVSDGDVDTLMQKLKNRQGEKEFRLAEIFIEVNNPENFEKATQFSMQLIDQAKQGAPFPQLARQFSASPSAAQNGEIGWVTLEDLTDPILKEALVGLQKGELRGPIKTNDGLYIIFMIDERKAPKVEGSKEQIELSLKKIASDNAEDLKEAHTKIKGCLSMESFFKDYPSPQTGDIGTVLLEELNPRLQDVLKDLDVSILSPVIKEPNVYARYMICKRQNTDQSKKITKDDIINVIGNEKLENLVQKKLQELRENAFIDIRI